MIVARHKGWNLVREGKSIEEIARDIGCEPSDLIAVREYTRGEWALREVPHEFRSTLSYMAYERGHSAGDDEISLVLEGLVSDLLPAIREFEERVRQEEKALGK